MIISDMFIPILISGEKVRFPSIEKNNKANTPMTISMIVLILLLIDFPPQNYMFEIQFV